MIKDLKQAASILSQAGFTAYSEVLTEGFALIFGMYFKVIKDEGKLEYWTQDKMVRVIFVYKAGGEFEEIATVWSFAQQNKPSIQVILDYYERNPRLHDSDKDRESVSRFMEKIRHIGFNISYNKHKYVDPYLNVMHPNRKEIIR